jgi:hypothetical protein
MADSTKDDVANIIAAQVTEYHEKPTIVYRIWCEDPIEPAVLGMSVYVMYDPNVKEDTFPEDCMDDKVDLRFQSTGCRSDRPFHLFATPIYNDNDLSNPPGPYESKYTAVSIIGPFSKDNEGFGQKDIMPCGDPKLNFIFEHKSLKWTWAPQIPRPDIRVRVERV